MSMGSSLSLAAASPSSSSSRLSPSSSFSLNHLARTAMSVSHLATSQNASQPWSEVDTRQFLISSNVILTAPRGLERSLRNMKTGINSCTRLAGGNAASLPFGLGTMLLGLPAYGPLSKMMVASSGPWGLGGRRPSPASAWRRASVSLCSALRRSTSSLTSRFSCLSCSLCLAFLAFSSSLATSLSTLAFSLSSALFCASATFACRLAILFLILSVSSSSSSATASSTSYSSRSSVPNPWSSYVTFHSDAGSPVSSEM
mmetsp:Transcript_3304/g.7607  ORF Transcript_3304/g.7607 Transcript_3304/m.7607 type:complete len:258 (-) Transcript_3304:180-953(-)